ncbi:Uroporphyrin-III C/tetrapyrrole (Corrin/Porphyrin) methyltransferase [Ferroglobus placidus DSM 10642]|uniref:Uroporphyrin-III C/tetrapyrrole (Corrin/Porphyrin) methyltransferase n=1 Tax=Ferroglobus placidus (strain DSM 10642 / AEDII12DO) TaxID=589924 RepID=D3S1D5_FERPA|nr:cobalt-precorrin-4/precorrin-4 C(11)-methyltransferase [Ferroglobus placidus]ADC66399.1 Uroporphyrin-III C/tetrapyrrole (Corrin/Porphyrin) methyltransferase [Ferroglobus placidus DSM 10642]
MEGKVYFVGAGPGDPELLTLKAYKLLKEADLIIYPGSLIEEDFLKEFEGKKVNSYGMKLEEIVSLIEKAVKEGKKVVRLQSGDPSIYGAINEQIRELEKRGIDVEVIPGVSSIFASAAALKSELTSPEVPSVVITRPAGKTLKEDEIEEFAKTNSTLVILLGVDKIDEIVKKVSKHRSIEEPAAVVYKASRKEEKVVVGTLGDIAEKVKREGIKRTAVIIIGRSLKKEGRSILYA